MHKFQWDKKHVEKKDYYRVLLTETLPYEVPVSFSNLGFYQKVKKGDFIKKELPLPFNKIKDDSIPFVYEIRNGESKKRILSIPHPLNQLEVVKLYEKYEEEIIYLCSRSEFSLRFPSFVGSYFYNKNLKVPDPDMRIVDTAGEDLISEGSSSFFSYRKCNFVYKFYDSMEYCDLEIKFGYLKKLDIKKCFYSLYTHSISWAIKGVVFSKNEMKSASLANRFDKVVRDCNYGETNGIIVGPEVSRIFSEIILQAIDIKLKNKASVLGYKADQDYAIRRYVDDYFVFANSEQVLEVITESLENLLRDYKLHLNESKEEVLRRPFVTGETAAKASVANLIEKHFLAMVSIKEDKNDLPDKAFCRKINVDHRVASMVREYRVVIHEKSVYASSVCNYSLTIMLNKINDIIRWSDIYFKEKSENFNNFLTVWLVFALYVFSLGFRPRACYIFSRFVIAITKNFLGEDNPYAANIKKILSERLKGIIENNASSNIHAVELFDLVQLLRWLGPTHEVDVSDFRAIISNRKDEISTNYFGIVAALDYCKKIRSRKYFKNEIESYIGDYFAGHNLSFHSAECFILIADLMSCPYISNKFKLSICKIIVKEYWSDKEIDKDLTSINLSAKKLFDYFLSKGGFWFYEWESLSESSFEPKVLKRKELRTAY